MRRLVAVVTGVAALLAAIQCVCVPQGFAVVTATAGAQAHHARHDCCPTPAGMPAPDHSQNHSATCSHCGPNSAVLTKGDAFVPALDATQLVALPMAFETAVLPAAPVAHGVGPDRSPPGRSRTLVDLFSCLII